MKKMKKILSLVLVLIMCFSVVPMTDLGIEASAASAFQWPMTGYSVTQVFGRQRSNNSRPYHSGIDMVSSNTNIYAAAAGTVVYKGYTNGNGNHVILEHNFNGIKLKTLYSHLSSYAECPAVGNGVSKNTRIGIMGNTGNSTGAHLHFAIFTGTSTDPLGYTSSYGANSVTENGHTYYNPDYVIKNNKLPSGESLGGGTSASHSRNTSYGTNFSATANEKIDVFNADHSDPGNYYIDKGDKCTIHEVYTDGCCQVTYPSSASPTGTRTYYAPFNKFSVAGNYADPIIELVYWGDNGTTTHFRPVVQIKNPETVDHVSFPTWSHNGDGAQNNLVWYDTVFNGGLCWFNDLSYNNFSYQFIESHCYVYGKNGSRQNVALPRNYNRIFTYELDVNMIIDGVRYNSGASGFTFDYYIDGKLVGNDISDWCEKHYCGQTYEIKDIKCRNGYTLKSGNLSGIITSNTEALLTFDQGAGVLDLNGLLDGTEHGSLSDYGTADIYINGTLYANKADFCETLPAGTKYEIKNIKASTGRSYNGVHSGSLSGTITGGTTQKIILSFSKIGYNLYFDVNHDNIKPNLYKPTKSTKTINGVTYQYDTTRDIIKLNGSLTASDGIIDSYKFKPEANSYYKVTAKVLSGTFSSSILVVEARNASGGTVGSRIYFDIYGTSSKTWYFSSADAASTANLQTWLYCSNANTAKINNAEIQIKIEKVASSSASGTEFSPSMKGMHYNEAYPSTMTPTRSGYTFDGWYTAATGGTKITSSSKYPASNQTLYAHWTCTHSTTEIRNAKSATCTTTGYTGDTYCKTCGTKTKTGTTIAKKSHSYTSSITTQPTCTKEGVKTYKCTCGASYTEAIAKKSHSIVTIPAVSATCTKTGLTEGKKCSVCGTVTVFQQIVAKKSHIDNNGDYQCDYGCGYAFEKPAPDTPTTPDEPENKPCSCNCHKGGISGFFFKLINFFEKLFGKNKVCVCGVKH